MQSPGSPGQDLSRGLQDHHFCTLDTWSSHLSIPSEVIKSQRNYDYNEFKIEQFENVKVFMSFVRLDYSCLSTFSFYILARFTPVKMEFCIFTRLWVF